VIRVPWGSSAVVRAIAAPPVLVSRRIPRDNS